MSRIRTVKPELFKHEDLFQLELDTGLPVRLAFIALFTIADREGRFKWRPRQLKLDCLPYDELDFSRVLDALTTRGFIVKYRVLGVDYGCICSFKLHQVINNKEMRSVLPSVDDAEFIFNLKSDSCDDGSTRDSRVNDALDTPLGTTQGEGNGKEGKGREYYCPEFNNSELENELLESNDKNSDLKIHECIPVVVFELPLNVKNTYHRVTQENLAQWSEIYPAVDVMQELRNMLGWLISNPKKKKTADGINRFINSWLGKAQNNSRAFCSPTNFSQPNKAQVQLDNISDAIQGFKNIVNLPEYLQ